MSSLTTKEHFNFYISLNDYQKPNQNGKPL